MLTEDHIFTIKTKDQQNVTDIQNGSAGVVISGLNVLKDKIKVGDLVFVVFGGDNPPWEPGFVGLAIVSQAPFDEGYDGGRNFRVKIDIKTYFSPIKRSDLVTYPATFGIIGIAPVVKWEPNQALTNVPKDKAIALLQATWEMRPSARHDIENLLGNDFSQISGPVKRFTETVSPLGGLDLRPEFIKWAPHKKPTKVGKAASEDTIKKYVGYLNCLNKPMSNTGNASGSGWDGVVEFITGHRPEKSYYEVEWLDEFDSMFGVLGKALSGEPAPDGVVLANYNQVATWANAPSIKKHMCLLAAYMAYREFLQWRDAEQKKKDEPNVATVDLLTIAIQVFKRERSTWVGKEGITYASVNTDVRSYYGNEENWSVERLSAPAAFSDFCIKHTWMMRNGAGCWSKLSKYDDAKRHEFLGWIDSNIVRREKPLAEVLVKDNGFYGFTNKAVTELLMKFHPDQFCLCNSPTIDALNFLNIAQWGFKENFVYDDYLKVMGVCAHIRERLIADGVTATLEGDTVADYITVNEFLIFVHHNKDLIKENAMAKEFKNASKKAKIGKRKLSKSVENDEMMQRLMAALRTKPFAILAGHSGTGKSQLVRRLAYMTCNDEVLLNENADYNAPGNYCMVQVKPSWHDSTDLLGYYTEMNGGKYHTTPFVEFICKAYAYPETPFFVCLDEMNLAPVEQYFAEFLSAIESYSETTKLTDRLIAEKADADEICGATKLTESLEEVKKHGLTIPRNLFVVGTVNVDETTCQFSRKVLDRAMTILMTAVSFKSMTEPNDPSKEECLDPDGIKFFLERPTQTSLVNGQMEWLDKIQKQVGDTPFAIAYRFANEYALYQAAYQMLMNAGVGTDGKPNLENVDSQKTAIDHVVLMKLLPRIHGARTEMEVWFNGKDGDADKVGLIKTLGDGQSVDMMKSILGRIGEYLSFWP